MSQDAARERAGTSARAQRRTARLGARSRPRAGGYNRCWVWTRLRLAMISGFWGAWKPCPGFRGLGRARASLRLSGGTVRAPRGGPGVQLQLLGQVQPGYPGEERGEPSGHNQLAGRAPGSVLSGRWRWSSDGARPGSLGAEQVAGAATLARGGKVSKLPSSNFIEGVPGTHTQSWSWSSQHPG